MNAFFSVHTFSARSVKTTFVVDDLREIPDLKINENST